MATITITIHTDNAAFEDAPETETASILHQLADDIANGRVDEDGTILRDINGNQCGVVSVEGDE